MNTFPSEQHAYNELDQDIHTRFRNALVQNLKNPFLWPFLVKAAWNQYRAAGRRRSWEKKGLHVPAFMIVSVTAKCNLRCAGCYSNAKHNSRGDEMDLADFRKILSEARALGIGIVLISGGEPLSRPGILDVMREFPQIVFILFTNGTLMDAGVIAALKKARHIIPVLSLEGDEKETDGRRGTGVFQGVTALSEELKMNRMLYGVSCTVTRNNFETLFGQDFIHRTVKRGSQLFFFVEYTPLEARTDDLVVTDEQRARVPALIPALRSAYPALFFAFPFGEEEYGGCLAAGRGFLHVSAAGDVEPCPFAPYSDTNIRHSTLKEALNSRILRLIRENHDKLQETSGGCALWKNREWVSSLQQKPQ